MSQISNEIKGYLKDGAWIRDLFEKGHRLKQNYGEKNVYDFSLGNPIVDPPTEFKEQLAQLVTSSSSNLHGYVSNQGILKTREKVAEFLQQLYHRHFSSQSIVITVGAGGALNVALRSIINPGDEVIVLVPYFVEYKYYINNVQGVPVYCPLDETFQISLEQISNKITERTKAIIINTPHNPTGCVFTKESILKLGNFLKEKEEEFNSNIYMLFDAPYTQLTYDQVEKVNPFDVYDRVIYASSFSKDLGLAGERIGFIAVDEEIPQHDLLISAFTFCNRILGFVNAPALMQHALANTKNLIYEQLEYEKRRNLIVAILKEAKFNFIKPQGGFFVFPKSPIKDDVEFCNFAAEKYNILLVPGTGFGCPGHFRLSFSVPLETIQGAKEPLIALNRNFIKP